MEKNEKILIICINKIKKYNVSASKNMVTMLRPSTVIKAQNKMEKHY